MSTIPTTEPRAFMAGDKVQWRRTFTDYPAGTYTLRYAFVGRYGAFDVTCTDNGNGEHLATVLSEATEELNAGTYQWVAYVLDGVDRIRLAGGETCIEPNLIGAGPTDTRTWAERVLEAVEAALENRASSEQASYSMGGRTISKMTPDEMISARQRLKAIVNREKQAEALARGKGNVSIIRVRG